MLGKAIITLVVGMVLGHSPNPFDKAMQKLDATQLHVIGTLGNLLQKQNIAAPWMKTSQMDPFRCLQTVVIPQACKDACPNTETMVGGLQLKMMASMLKHKEAMDKMSAAPTGESSVDGLGKIEEMMTVLMPMMEDMMTVMFEDMCTNKDSYTCLVTNAAKCASPSSADVQSGGMGGLMALDPNNPVKMAMDFGPQLNCMCDVCPGAKKTFVEMYTTLMSVIMSAFSSMASAMSSPEAAAAMNSKMEKDLLKGFCPFIGMSRCFTANPTQCGGMLSQDVSGLGSAGLDMKDGLKELEANCTKEGIAIEAVPKVSTDITVKGLDFDKVESNAAVKADVVALVKKQFLAKLPGYVADDLTVTLSKGSVIAKVEVIPMPGTSADQLKSTMTKEVDAIAAEVVKDVQVMPAEKLNGILESGATKDSVTAAASVPVAAGQPAAKPEISGAYETGVFVITLAVLARAIL